MEGAYMSEDYYKQENQSALFMNYHWEEQLKVVTNVGVGKRLLALCIYTDIYIREKKEHQQVILKLISTSCIYKGLLFALLHDFSEVSIFLGKNKQRNKRPKPQRLFHSM